MEEKEKWNKVPPPLAFAACMQQVIGQLKAEKKFPAMRTHVSAMNSFMEFMKAGKEEDAGDISPRGPDTEDIPFPDVFTPGRLKSYQKWLLQRGASWDTVSTYMRRLKVTYNRILPPGSDGHDFKLFADVYTKVEPKTKRALKEAHINVLANTGMDTLPGELRPVLAYFLLMFLFRGMPFIDLAYLRKRDLRDGVITYCRHKTGRQLIVRIPKEAVPLFEQCKDRNPLSPYLFPILDGRIRDEWELYQYYQKALRGFNRRLAVVAGLLLPGVKLSSYTPRHTWATLAFHMGIKTGVIRQALGHSSIRVTETYLKPFEDEKVDQANDLLISVVTEVRQTVNGTPANAAAIPIKGYMAANIPTTTGLL